MDFLEKDLEDILYNSPQKQIRHRGLYFFSYNKIFRQVNLGNYGISDLITFKRWGIHDNLFTIYELKNKTLDASAFWQLVRYMKGFKHLLTQSNFNIKNYKLRGVMIGRTLDTKSDFCYFPTVCPSITYVTYDYKVDGINFNVGDDSYCLINPGVISLKSMEYNSVIGLARDLLSEPLDFEGIKS